MTGRIAELLAAGRSVVVEDDYLCFERTRESYVESLRRKAILPADVE